MPLNALVRQRTHALASSLNAHRLLLYTILSLAVVSAVVTNALKHYSNFYSVAISLAKSSRSVLALANFGFLLALLCGHIVQRIFFGPLRANEVERLYDRLWFFITESLLAFTIFRDEFDIPFALMFGFLLFVKAFHWLAGDRIEWMDQRPYPGPSALFHLRMSTLFVILWMADLIVFLIAVENTMANGVGGMVLFASEYGILMASVLNTISKYLLSAYELRRAGQRGGENAPPWENKSMWVFYIELATDFLKLTTYLVFFTIIITFYGLPLNIVRDVYITARSFVARLRALHRYQTATRNMDQRYPNATEVELSAMSDRTCIICREEMVLQPVEQAPADTDGPNTTPKKLPCGHIFHFHCLRSWLERQQSCPTCRRTVLDANPRGQDVNAAAPAPAAAPRQPNLANLPGAQNQNQQGINNPLGNPLGLMGRLFGPPAQPPIVPGQMVQGQFPQNQNLVQQDPGNPAGQLPQGVLIQYHIQYQIPRNQQPQQNIQQPPQVLQPAPQFVGFPGPGGVWQQWPAGLQDGVQIAPGHQEPVPPNNDPPRAHPTPTSQRSVPSASPASPAERTASLNHRDDRPSTPREAAALAALQRLNNERSSSRNSSSVNTQASTLAEPARPTSPSPTPLPGGPLPSNGSTSGQRVDVPTLIPLYDYSAYGIDTNPPTHTPNGTAPLSNGVTPPHSLRPPDGGQSPQIQVSTGARSPQPDSFRPYARTSHSPRASSDLRNQQAGASQFASTHLPPALTDEQLATMDRITREAIDERLRVLEGVSGAVYRCIEDLMRMRSALPSPTPTSLNTSIPTINPTGSSSNEGAEAHLGGDLPNSNAPAPPMPAPNKSKSNESKASTSDIDNAPEQSSSSNLSPTDSEAA